MHNAPSKRACGKRSAANLGAQIAADRAARIKWKDLELKYGLSRARLDQIWGEFKGRHRCACPSCGHVFDPKPKARVARDTKTAESCHGTSWTQT